MTMTVPQKYHVHHFVFLNKSLGKKLKPFRTMVAAKFSSRTNFIILWHFFEVSSV